MPRGKTSRSPLSQPIPRGPDPLTHNPSPKPSSKPLACRYCGLVMGPMKAGALEEHLLSCDRAPAGPTNAQREASRHADAYVTLHQDLQERLMVAAADLERLALMVPGEYSGRWAVVANRFEFLAASARLDLVAQLNARAVYDRWVKRLAPRPEETKGLDPRHTFKQTT